MILAEHFVREETPLDFTFIDPRIPSNLPFRMPRQGIILVKDEILGKLPLSKELFNLNNWTECVSALENIFRCFPFQEG